MSRLRVVLENANGAVLDCHDVGPDEDAVEVAQEMLDELGHLACGDVLRVEASPQ